MPRKERDKDGLTQNDKMFCIEYDCNGNNGTEAWLSVHPKAAKATSRVEASRLLAKPNIRAYLDKLRQETINELGISKKNTLKKLAELAYYLNKKDKNFEKKFKDHGTNVIQALDKLARVQKMYQPDVQVNIEGDEYTGPMIILPKKDDV